MKFTSSMILAAAGLVSATSLCTGSSRNENGNWFCSKVNMIKYDGVGVSGTYKEVTGMSPNGQCPMKDVSYGGSFAPYNQDFSIHIRGPIHLKEFAVYHLNGNKKRDQPSSTQIHARRHGHGHVHAHTHARAHDEEEDDESLAKRAGTWKRSAYYNGASKTAQSLVFLGNYGGQGSGVWDGTWGNSLAYLNADGNAGTNSPQILKDITIGSNKEFSIWSNTKCDGSCGFSRANDVAYKGWGNSNKIFLFHFKMPLDGDRGFNGDMPAIWGLNGRISRTQQYGGCSCWQSGCGEFDIFEVLASGDNKAKTTFHYKNAIGSSDYFERPTNNYIKAAAIFDEASNTVTFRVLNSGINFDTDINDNTVRDWIAGK